MATFFQDKIAKDFRLSKPQQRAYALRGIAAEDKAIALNPNYPEAMIYKNILLRQQANTEKDPAVQKQLINLADLYRRSWPRQLCREAALCATLLRSMDNRAISNRHISSMIVLEFHARFVAQKYAKSSRDSGLLFIVLFVKNNKLPGSYVNGRARSM